MKRALLLALIIFSPALSSAEDVKTILDRTQSLIKDEHYSQALTELSWAQKEIAKMHMNKLEGFLPATVGGLKGEPATSNEAMGFLTVERVYRDASGAEIKVSLLGSAGNAGAAQGLGALAGLAQMAAAMGGAAPGVESIRVQNRRATLDKSSGMPKMMMSLNSGLTLNAEAQSGTVKVEQLQGLLEAIKLDDLEKYAASN